jgi:hypothetical protein
MAATRMGFKMMRQPAACVAAFALLASLCATSHASDFSLKTICASHSCRTLVASAQARVVQAINRHGYDIVWGEWLPTRYLSEIDFPGEEPITALALAGRFFAYATHAGGGGSPSVSVNVLDLRGGPAGGGWTAADDIESGSRGVTDLALTPSGTVAWLMEGRFLDPAAVEEGPHPFSRALFAVPAGKSEPIFLTDGTSISPGSLAAVPGHVYWTEDGIARSYLAP